MLRGILTRELSCPGPAGAWKEEEGSVYRLGVLEGGLGPSAPDPQHLVSGPFRVKAGGKGQEGRRPGSQVSKGGRASVYGGGFCSGGNSTYPGGTGIKTPATEKAAVFSTSPVERHPSGH